MNNGEQNQTINRTNITETHDGNIIETNEVVETKTGDKFSLKMETKYSATK